MTWDILCDLNVSSFASKDLYQTLQCSNVKGWSYAMVHVITSKKHMRRFLDNYNPIFSLIWNVQIHEITKNFNVKEVWV